MQKIVFLDRDGTICEDFGQPCKAKDIINYPLAAEAIALLKNAGFKTIIVTNQSKIGRGYTSKEDVEEANSNCLKQLSEKNSAAIIDVVKYCPHTSDDVCDCRKPLTGMIKNSSFPFNFNAAECWMIGDKCLDLEFGKNLGIPNSQCLLLLTGHGEEELAKTKSKFGKELHVFAEIFEACKFIIKEITV